MSERLPIAPSFRLDGQRAAIMGAGRGIGYAIAAGLAEAGASVTLVARSAGELERASNELRDVGRNADVVVLDVTDLSAVESFFAGRAAFDVMVNNAGINRPMPMQDVTESDFNAVLDLNLKSAYFTSQAAARRMIELNLPGSLIHIGSQMGHVGGKDRSLYCASKWALEGMSKAFALDLAAHGIRSNTIAPTFIDTSMTAPFLQDPSFRNNVLSRIKLGRLGRVEDVMGACIFLASSAAAMITGTSIVVDGGWTAD